MQERFHGCQFSDRSCLSCPYLTLWLLNTIRGGRDEMHQGGEVVDVKDAQEKAKKANKLAM